MPRIPFRLDIHTNRLPIYIGKCGDYYGSHHQTENRPFVRKKGRKKETYCGENYNRPHRSVCAYRLGRPLFLL